MTADPTKMPEELKAAIEAITQALDDGGYVLDYFENTDAPIFDMQKRDGGAYCHQAAEMLMDAYKALTQPATQAEGMADMPEELPPHKKLYQDIFDWAGDVGTLPLESDIAELIEIVRRADLARTPAQAVDVEALWYELTDILENCGIPNLYAVVGGRKIAKFIAASGYRITKEGE